MSILTPLQYVCGNTLMESHPLCGPDDTLMLLVLVVGGQAW